MEHVVQESSADDFADVCDEDLVAEFLAGRPEAFACLYRRYYRRTYRLAFGMTGRHHAAEDLAQEVFMRVYERLDRFEGRSRFSTWFYRVAVNQCMRLCDRRRDGAERSLDDETRDVLLADAACADQAILAAQVQAHVRRALLSLRPAQRMLVVLKDLEGLSYAEIADRMDCSEGTVASRLNRARRLLGRKLDHLRGTY